MLIRCRVVNVRVLNNQIRINKVCESSVNTQQPRLRFRLTLPFPSTKVLASKSLIFNFVLCLHKNSYYKSHEFTIEKSAAPTEV